MSNIDFIQEFFEKYIAPSQQSNIQINDLKKILYVNPLLIYETEEKWNENRNKLQYLTAYNQLFNITSNTLAYFALIHLFALGNIRISKQYSLRNAWAMNFCKKTFWIPSAAILGYTNLVVQKEKLFEKEIEKMKQLPKEQSYLYSEKYVKEKYFKKINEKLNSLCEDSYIVANTKKQIEKEQNNEQQMAQQEDNSKKESKQFTNSNRKLGTSTQNNEKQKQNLRTDDYYFEIAEIIEELDEESFFD